MTNEQTNATTGGHTPRPWTYEPGDNYVREDSTGATVALVCEDDGHVDPKYRRKMPRKANARLISAAPDLLVACEAMLKDLRETRDTGTCSRSRDSQIKDLANALAKARGGPQ